MSSQVIIKRVPQQHVVHDPEESMPIPCDCADPVFGSSNPSCKICKGTGKIQGYLPAESTIQTTGDKKSWISHAKITRETASVVFDDEEEGTISDIHAFFDKDEDVLPNDVVIDSSTREVFIVVMVTDVRDFNNIIMKDCALEPYVPPS